MACDEKYSVLNRDNLTIPIQTHSSEKEKYFAHLFAAFLKSSLNFEHFEKTEDPHSFCISKVMDFEKVFT